MCEDISITNEKVGNNLANKDHQDILEQITVGKSFKEVRELCGKGMALEIAEPIKYEWSFQGDVKILIEFSNDPRVAKTNLNSLYIIFWDYESTKTASDIARESLTLGLSVREINEMFGEKGQELSSGFKFTWNLEEGKTLYVVVYLDNSDASLPLEDKLKFNGCSYIKNHDN